MLEESAKPPAAESRQGGGRSAKRWAIAGFFVLLNAVILGVAVTFWLSRGKSDRSQADLDVAPPARKGAAPVPASNLPPKPPSLQPTADDPQPPAAPAQPTDQNYVRAKNKLKSAWHWMEKNDPDLARKFARQAIELAPDSDVAKDAQSILDTLQ